MANQEHLELLKQGVSQWNAWRKQDPEIKPDLINADLSYADLSGSDLSRTRLTGARLMHTNLSYADLKGADLVGVALSDAHLHSANLTRAELSDAYLFDADLSGASLRAAYMAGVNLTGANLSGATLSGATLNMAILDSANLTGTDLYNANIGATFFARVDLRTAKGLAEIQHSGPSHIELYTIQLPQDGSALYFLRGAGVPDEWINFWRITAMHPIQYHSLFISYSSKDEILARRLHADLQAKGVRCWFVPEDMKIGDKIRPRIDEAINIQDKLLLLLSEHSIASTWVEDEVEAAMEKEHQQQREVLFPVRLDESVMQTMQAWAAKLRRTRHIGNFTSWTDPQAYQRAFERLLRDLKAEKTPDGK